MRMVTLNVLFAAAVSVTAIGPVHASQSKDRASEVSKYDKGDTNRKPTGGRRKLAYGLVPGEAG